MMMRVTIPAEAGSTSLKSGRLPNLMGEAMTRMTPEAAYFMTDNGHRTACFIIDLKDQSQMPAFAEPFFGELNAQVEFMPVMTADDLKKGLANVK